MTPPDSANIAANESARPFPPSSGVHLARGRQGQLDLLFVSMPSRSNEVSVPLAFLMLAGFLDKHSDFTSEILEIKIPAYLDRTPQRLAVIEEELIRQMIQKDPRLIAFSLFPGDLPAFLLFGRRVKERLPNTPIVVGGILPTKDSSSLHFIGSPADIVVLGDGEEVLKRLLSGDAFDQIPGLRWVENGALLGEGVALYAHTIDYIPAYHKLDMDYYSQISTGVLRPYFSKGVFVIFTLGCPFKCVFCAASQSPVKQKSITVFIEELRLLKERYRHNSFLIIDETFLLNKARRALEFCDAYEASGIGMPWAMQTRSNLLTEELIVRLKKAGCVHMSFGVESGSNRLLRFVSKGLTAEKNLEAFLLCRRYGVKTFANMMLNLPGEEAEDIRLSEEWLQQAKPNHVAFALATPLLGTQMYEEHVKPPLTHAEYGLWGSNDAFTRIIDPRFRVACHDLNLNKILAKMTLRFHMKSAFGLICLDPWYREKVLGTMSKIELLAAIRDRIWMKMRRYVYGVPYLLAKKAKEPSVEHHSQL